MTLHLVPDAAESDPQTLLRAQLEATLAKHRRDERDAWLKALDHAFTLTASMAEDDGQPVGLQELARVLAEHIRRASNTAVAIQGRVT